MGRTAPYAFVRLDERVPQLADGLDTPWRCHDRYRPDLLHGELQVRLRTLTPLFIGEATAIDAARGTEQCSARGGDGLPVVPGSSWRGTLRAVHRILTGSAIEGLRSEPGHGRVLFHIDRTPSQDYRRRVPTVQGGVLRLRDDGGWEVEPGTLYRLPHTVLHDRVAPSGAVATEHDEEHPYPRSLRDGRLLPGVEPADLAGWWFAQVGIDPLGNLEVTALCCPVERPCSDEHGNHVEVVLALTGIAPGGNRPFDYAIELTGRAARRADRAVAEFARSVTPFQRRVYPLAADLTDDDAGGEPADGEPVFFTLRPDEQGHEVVKSMGRTKLHRIKHLQAPANLLPPGHSDTVLDPNRVLFGTVAVPRSGGRLGPVTSRLAFDPMVPVLDEGQDPAAMWSDSGYVELLQPHDTLAEHYLETGSYFAEHGAQLAGYKVFRHRPFSPKVGLPWSLWAQHLETAPDNEAGRVIRPVAQGVTFEGVLRFRNLTPEELGMLLLTITEPDVSEAPLLAHKLGGGRALGLGSAAVTERTLRYLDPGSYYARWGQAPHRVPGSDGFPTVQELEAKARDQLSSRIPDPDQGCGHRGSSKEDRKLMGQVARPSDVRRVGELWVTMAYRNALSRDETAVMAPGAAGWTSTERLPALLAR